MLQRNQLSFEKVRSMPKPIDLDELMPAQEAAEYLDMSYGRLANTWTRGTPGYPKPQKIGSAIMFHRRDLDSWLLENRKGPRGEEFRPDAFPVDLLEEHVKRKLAELPLNQATLKRLMDQATVAVRKQLTE